MTATAEKRCRCCDRELPAGAHPLRRFCEVCSPPASAGRAAVLRAWRARNPELVRARNAARRRGSHERRCRWCRLPFEAKRVDSVRCPDCQDLFRWASSHGVAIDVRETTSPETAARVLAELAARLRGRRKLAVA